MNTSNLSASNLTWIRNDKIDYLGTCLDRRLPLISSETIKKLFGKLPAGTQPHSKMKYSSTIVLYNNVEGTEIPYTLYTFYGEWRIGSHDDGKFADQLADMLTENEAAFQTL